MIVYRCSSCRRIFQVPSPLTLCKCGACGGWLTFFTKRDDPCPISVTETKNNEPRGYDAVLRIAKTLCYIWGTGGDVNLLRKYIRRENVDRKDLFHGIFPWIAAGIIGDSEHPEQLKRFFSPPDLLGGIQPQTGREQKLRNMVQRKKEQRPYKEPEYLPEISADKELNSNLEQLKELIRKWEHTKANPEQPDSEAPNVLKGTEDPRAFEWRRILSSYPRILILGGQGTGKSCLAYYLVEILRERGRCYVYRLPEEGISLIPEWLGICQEIADVPPGSLVLIDEAHLAFFSRESQSRANREIAKIINLARQKEMALIFVAHESRHLDKNILSGIDTLIIKRPAPLQVALDRSFLKPYLLKAERIFRAKSDISARMTSYISFSPGGFEGQLENPKPSFWSEKLSHIFASGYMGGEQRPARELTKEEKRKRAKQLHDDYGYSYGDIAKDLGLGKTTVYRWLNENKRG